MYIFTVRFQRPGQLRGANAPQVNPQYDEAGNLIDANNIRVVASSWADAIAWAEANREGREISSCQRSFPVEVAPLTRAA